MSEVDALLAELARWGADVRAGDAARSRARERWLRRQASEDATFTGVALDLAEQGAGVAVRTLTGRTLRGRMAAVARDFCVLVHDEGAPTFVALAAVATLRPEAGHRAGDAESNRAAAVDTTLADVLAALAGDRPRVRVVTRDGREALAGELRAAGTDVATLRLDGEPPTAAYVRLAALSELTVLG